MEGQASVSAVDEVTKSVAVRIPAASFDSEVKGELSTVARKAAIKGFRIGKAPVAMVERMYGDKVRFDVAYRMVSKSLGEAIKSNDIKVIGSPKIEKLDYKAGTDIECTASLSLFPEPKVTGYTDLDVTAHKHSVSDSDIAEVIGRIQKRKAVVTPVTDRTDCKAGDVISVTVGITPEDSAAQPAEPATFALGEQVLPTEVEAAILGMKVGDTRTLSVTVDAEYKNEELRGKKVEYVVSLKGLSTRKLPELSDAFVDSLGGKEKTLAELNATVKDDLEKRAKDSDKRELYAALIDKLADANTFKIPQLLIDEEIKGLIARSGMVDPSKVNVDEINPEPFRAGLGGPAERRVRATIIIDQIAEQEKIVPSDSDIDVIIKRTAADTRMSEEQVKNYFMKDGQNSQLFTEARRDKVLEFVASKAKVKFEAHKLHD